MLKKVSPMMQHWSKALEVSGRVALGAVFVYASWDKILDPAAFARAIANYQILPGTWVNGVAWLLPWLEMISGICLISGRLVRGGALVIAAMLVVFLAALGYNAYRGLDIACGCFSLDSTASGQMYLDFLRDIVLLTIALLVMARAQAAAPTMERSGQRPR